MRARDITTTKPSAEDFALLVQVIGDVGRRARLSTDDAHDFGQTVHLTLLERGYDAFTRFSGRSSLKTYLTVVVQRLLLDWRRSQFGKWRTSAVARRLGPAAIALETLIFRDGHTPEEAIQVLACQPGVDRARLGNLVERLPARLHSRHTVSIESLEYLGAIRFDDPLERRDSQRAERRLRRRLATALRELTADDRRLIDLRYRRRCTVPTMAQTLAVDSKLLYRRCDRALRQLRASIEREA